MSKLASRIRSNRLWGGLRLLAGLAMVGSISALATQTSTLVKLQPQSLALAVGERAMSSVEVTDVANLFGFELHLVFDPSRVQVVDGNPDASGIQLQLGDMFAVGDGFLVANQVDNELGTALFAFTLLAPAPPMSGDGTLVQFELQAIAAGATDLLLEQTILASQDGEALPFVAQNSSVLVEGEGVPGSEIPPPDVEGEGEPVSEIPPPNAEGEGELAADVPESGEEAEPALAESDEEQELAVAELEGGATAAEQEDVGSDDGFRRFGFLMIGLALVAALLVGLLVRWGIKQG